MKYLIENTCQSAFDELLRSTHDVPFGFGPFGEQFLSLQAMFVGSVGKLEPMSVDPEALSGPLPNEPHIALDWNLPMVAEAQTMLFCRVRAAFDRVSWMIPVAQRKRYRLTLEELHRHRNMVVLFCQILGHMRTQLGSTEVDQWVHDVQSGLARDEDLLNLLHTRPPTFAMSMLISQQDRAKKHMEDFESKKVEQVAKEREQVTVAQWNFFQAALKQDWANIEKVSAAPKQVRQRLHVKQVGHRAKLIKIGESGCSAYQDRRVASQFNMLLKMPDRFSSCKDLVGYGRDVFGTLPGISWLTMLLFV